jgi:prepilin-type N-terminal cleavage/methylation domain-containing protein
LKPSLKKISGKKGFTLIELLVTLSIFVILTTLVLANDNKFGNSTSITDLAYDIALSIRQAQTYGFAVKSINGSYGNETSTTTLTHFGIDFNMSSKTTYTIFADQPTQSGTIPPDGKFEPSEAVETYTLTNGFKIKDLCSVNDTTNAETCTTALGATNLDIIFKRPDPDAYSQFYYGAGSSGNAVTSPQEHVRIIIESGDGSILKAVDVLSSGQISVEDEASS